MSNFVVRVCETPSDRDAAMQIRFEVFVDEQAVPPELEPDEYDAIATHFLILDETESAAGTARLVDKGAGIAKIGRVAIRKPYRGAGVGFLLMQAVLEKAIENGLTVAVLDAQVYVIPFYERLGFAAEGPVFDDAGIDHRRMTKPLKSAPPITGGQGG